MEMSWEGKKTVLPTEEHLATFGEIIIIYFFCQLLGNLPIYIAQYSQSESSGFSSLLAYKVKEQ